MHLRFQRITLKSWRMSLHPEDVHGGQNVHNNKSCRYIYIYMVGRVRKMMISHSLMYFTKGSLHHNSVKIGLSNVFGSIIVNGDQSM